jgi:hypothetical protein
MMQHARWTPRVAKIFERHELGPQRLGSGPILLNACIEQQAARA